MEEKGSFEMLIGGSHYLFNSEGNILDSFVIIGVNSIITIFNNTTTLLDKADETSVHRIIWSER